MEIIKITAPFDAAKAGGSSTQVHNFVYNRILEGYKLTRGDGTITLQKESPEIRPAFSDLAALVGNGGTFEGVKMGIQFDFASRNNQVPSGVRGRDTTDENGDPAVRTWAQWVQAGGLEYKLNDAGDTAIFKAAFTGQLLNSAELAIIHALAYANVIDWSTLITLANSPEYNPE